MDASRHHALELPADAPPHHPAEAPPHPDGPPAPHLTPAERTALGRARRAQAPRSTFATLTLPPDRDPVAVLEAQAATRVPELVPVRYGRMLASEFAFFRGGALIMATDLAATPTSGLTAQICGDAHLANFGLFASPERRLVFDLNDFDETAPGPWEWDVRRLLASVEIAGRHRGFTRAERRAAVRAGAEEYRTSMAAFAAMSTLDVWYASLDSDTLVNDLRGRLSARGLRAVQANLSKTTTRDRFQAQGKLTAVIDGRRRIVAQPPLVVPLEDLVTEEVPSAVIEARVRDLLALYRRTVSVHHQHLLAQYEYVHMARKVVGVGSVGTRAWVVLLRGRDDDDPLVLQVKEAQASVVTTALGDAAVPLPGTGADGDADGEGHQGRRVVVGQRAMQAASDLFLGWVRTTGVDGATRDFFVRQLRDWKGSADLEAVLPRGLVAYARLCAWTLARAHARTGDRVAIAGYLGNGSAFEDAAVAGAYAYADQNARDYATFRAAVESGRLTAVTGV